METVGPIPIEDRAANKEKHQRENQSVENLNPGPILSRLLLASRKILQTLRTSGKAHPENQQTRGTAPPAQIQEGQIPPNRLIKKIKRSWRAVAQVERAAGKGNHRRQVRNRRMTATTGQLHGFREHFGQFS